MELTEKGKEMTEAAYKEWLVSELSKVVENLEKQISEMKANEDLVAEKYMELDSKNNELARDVNSKAKRLLDLTEEVDELREENQRLLVEGNKQESIINALLSYIDLLVGNQ